MEQFTTSSFYDAVIVGAGPGGCFTANFLKNDFKVLMVDSAAFPRSKPCGGLLTEESKDFIKKIKLPDSVFSTPEYVDITYMDHDNGIDVRQKKNYLNVDRNAFDFELLNLSKNSIDFSSNTRFLGAEEINGGADGYKMILEKNGKKTAVKSRFLIGADGALSTVRKKATGTKMNQLIAMQEWFSGNHNIDAFYFIFSKDVTNYYSWLIPKGNSFVCGTAFPIGTDVLKKFQLLKQKIKHVMGNDAAFYKKEACLLTKIKSTEEICLGSNNIFLVGEAAGLVSPSTGDGISFALRSGFNCAQAIKSAAAAPLESYKELCRPLICEIGQKLKKAEVLLDPVLRAKFLSNRINLVVSPDSE
ncbi:MAG: FAD-dependent monooxygenase [Nanoarchaeota archaeon]|nr:FAD-dependent monooxygenase [Nanoarchaeota archaeon]MBU4300859.1 FAD-dependent monooxygenase [Nanoarchaeota archaeon]MBU4451560.1 FAD-dependent monooxygenase [Nanoarchaeota archaeon]MCG2724491.1 FAD-dependent monooxygenase [archaeon]